MQKKRSLGFLVTLNSVHFGTNYLWLAYESLILPMQIGRIEPSSLSDLYLGLVAFFGVSIGVIISLLSGIFSDNYSIFFGKRSPYILIGSVITVISLYSGLLPLGSIYLVFLVFATIQIGTNISSGSYQPLLPDLIIQEQRGKAAGINGFATLIGNAAGIGVTGYLDSLDMYADSLIVMMAVLLATALFTTLTIRNNETPVRPRKFGFLRATKEIFRPRKGYETFFILVAGSFMFFLGITGLSFFEYYYFQNVLGIANPASEVAIAGVAVLIFSALGSVLFGSLSDRYGRKLFLLASPIISGVAIALIPALHSFIMFVVVGSFIGLGFGVFFSVSKAMASDLAPKHHEGKYMAYYNISVSESSAIASLLYGVVLASFASSPTGFMVVFEMSAIFYLFAFVILLIFTRRNSAETPVPVNEGAGML